MDMNQIMSDGRTIIFGTQCATGSGSFEYTKIVNGGTHWYASNIPCHPKTWTANTWHHVQIASHRDDDGVVTYDWVNLNGTYTDFKNATGSSAEKLGWPAGDLLLTFSWTEPVPVAGPLRPILTKRLSTDGDMANCNGFD